jgi:hypothetical protein
MTGVSGSGRGSKTQVRAGDAVELPVDTAQVHFLDPATGEVVY